MTDAQINTAQVSRTTAMVNGRWSGSYDECVGGAGGRWHEPLDWDGWSQREFNRGKPTEKLVVPSFDGEAASDGDVGRSARSYVRKVQVQVWLRCTKMPPDQRGLALYHELQGKAWVYAKELDVDVLASENGISYFLEWIQTRFMEVEITKVSNMMVDLFKRCRRRRDQSVRDFNVELERLVLRLREVHCELPPLKGWLYLDNLRLPESEELTLLSSVNKLHSSKIVLSASRLVGTGVTRHGKMANGEETATP